MSLSSNANKRKTEKRGTDGQDTAAKKAAAATRGKKRRIDNGNVDPPTPDDEDKSFKASDVHVIK